MKRAGRTLDVVVFGATGFVGRLVAEYLAGHAPEGVRIGLAGRSMQRLTGIRDSLGSRAAAWPLLQADAADLESLAALAAATRVVATTVGPYRQQGIRLVAACASAGTHYADLAGEVLFMRECIDRQHDAAVRSGARIVNACGFDSIPSDLGVLLLHQAAEADGSGALGRTTLVLSAVKGGVSGGTVASLKGQLSELKVAPHLRQIIDDAYALSPDRTEEPDHGDERDLTGFTRDDELGIWLGPFVMAGSNTRVVRRSNALQSWAYGRDFIYRETMGFGDGLSAPVKAAAMSAALGGLITSLGFGPSRALLDRVLPQPGSGPNPSTRRSGYFRIKIHTRTSSGARYVANVAAQGDPGYAATSVMLGESALCLALDDDRLPSRAGVLTPATAMGSALVDRLRAAGLTFEVRRVEPAG